MKTRSSILPKSFFFWKKILISLFHLFQIFFFKFQFSIQPSYLFYLAIFFVFTLLERIYLISQIKSNWIWCSNITAQKCFVSTLTFFCLCWWGKKLVLGSKKGSTFLSKTEKAHFFIIIRTISNTYPHW